MSRRNIQLNRAAAQDPVPASPDYESMEWAALQKLAAQRDLYERGMSRADLVARLQATDAQ